LIQRGELRAIKIGAATRIPLAEVDAWIQRHLGAASGDQP
jgi:excisionase family DNA binding protein